MIIVIQGEPIVVSQNMYDPYTVCLFPQDGIHHKLMKIWADWTMYCQVTTTYCIMAKNTSSWQWRFKTSVIGFNI